MATEDPLELEHVIGYTGSYTNSVQYHPIERDTIVFHVGCVVVVANVNDPHRQEFLRGHGEEITCIALADSGRYIASGQLGSTTQKGNEAPVIIWDHASRQELYRLYGLTSKVVCIAFSRDDRFVAAADEMCRQCIWDMQSGQVVNVSKCERNLTFLLWSSILPSQGGSGNTARRNSRNPRYKLCAAAESQLKMMTLDFDVKSMQYTLSSENLALPSAGMVRTYHNATTHMDDRFILCGTSAGELSVFNTESNVFRACVPVSAGGLLSLTVNKELVYAGCGDGKVKLLNGVDQEWIVQAETLLQGRIVSLSLSSDGTSLIAGTSFGNMYQLDPMTLQGSVLAQNHISAVNAVSFAPQGTDTFATCSENGVVRVWDLSDYAVLMDAHVPGGKSRCCEYVDDGTVITGWVDGSVRCHNQHTSEQLWKIANAHRGAVTALFMSPHCMLTGGEDGNMRVWTRTAQEFVTQFAEHKKAITSVLVDPNRPSEVHTCSHDRTVVTVDLKQERKTNYHSVKEGHFLSMCQRKDGEQELITCSNDGVMLVWDCDEPQPVGALLDPSRQKLNHITLSPSGRYIAVAGDDLQVNIWDITSNQMVSCGIGHSDSVLMARVL